jgi:hypothetical protein
MRTDEIKFINELAAQTKTHADWLVLMRFGLNQLLSNQPLLMALIEAEFRRRYVLEHSSNTSIPKIFEELGLRLNPVQQPS